jgi:hypothetical protein
LAAIEAAPPLEILQGDPTIELEEWANTVRLPAPALDYLKNLGIDEVSDLFVLSDEDMLAMKKGKPNPKDVYTSDISSVMYDDPEKGDLMKPQESLNAADPDTVYAGQTSAASLEGGFVNGSGTSFAPGAELAGLKYIQIRWLVLITDKVRLLKPAEEEHVKMLKDDIKENFPTKDWINRMQNHEPTSADQTYGLTDTAAASVKTGDKKVLKNAGNKLPTSKWINKMQTRKSGGNTKEQRSDL